MGKSVLLVCQPKTKREMLQPPGTCFVTWLLGSAAAHVQARYAWDAFSMQQCLSGQIVPYATAWGMAAGGSVDSCVAASPVLVVLRKAWSSGALNSQST